MSDNPKGNAKQTKPARGARFTESNANAFVVTKKGVEQKKETPNGKK